MDPASESRLASTTMKGQFQILLETMLIQLQSFRDSMGHSLISRQVMNCLKS
jgi:hypothetical protein